MTRAVGAHAQSGPPTPVRTAPPRPRTRSAVVAGSAKGALGGRHRERFGIPPRYSAGGAAGLREPRERRRPSTYRSLGAFLHGVIGFRPLIVRLDACSINGLMTEQKSVTETIKEYREQATRLLDGEEYPPTLEQAMYSIAALWNVVDLHNLWINENKQRITELEERVSALGG